MLLFQFTMTNETATFLEGHGLTILTQEGVECSTSLLCDKEMEFTTKNFIVIQ